MKNVRIPISLIPYNVAKKFSKFFFGIAERISSLLPFLGLNLKQADYEISEKEYLSVCLINDIVFFVFFLIAGYSLLLITGKGFYIGVFFGVLVFTIFAFINQISYPKIAAGKKIKDIERNLLPAIREIIIQLNSGVPLFDILSNIADGNYGGVSLEFKKAVKDINMGKDQIVALDEIASRNPSLFFRRVIWQIVNGMKAGADMSGVMKDVASALEQEQVIQIQEYGSQLNPMAMFYMLFAIIIPSLGMVFTIALSSLVALSKEITLIILFGLLVMDIFFQIMFLGIIKSRRPNLLGVQ